MFRLSGSDTTFFLDEPVEPQHTLKVAIFDEASSRTFDFNRVTEALAGAVEVLPQMQWRPQPVPFGLGRPTWVTDPGFDIRNHVRRARLPRPGTKAQLCRKISEATAGAVREYLLAEGFPTERPVVANAAAKVRGEGDGRLFTQRLQAAFDELREATGVSAAREPVLAARGEKDS
jgi:Wax ester synthase/diacylglycerol acyltransferase catalytic domain